MYVGGGGRGVEVMRFNRHPAWWWYMIPVPSKVSSIHFLVTNRSEKPQDFPPSSQSRGAHFVCTPIFHSGLATDKWKYTVTFQSTKVVSCARTLDSSFIMALRTRLQVLTRSSRLCYAARRFYGDLDHVRS